MCGIVGFFAVNPPSEKERKALRDLLYLDMLRGKDSTGVAFIRPNLKAEMYKCLGTPWHLEGFDDYVKTFKSPFKGFIGHNRLATKGQVSKENAHPFRCKHIIGVHNGTMTHLYKMKDYGTDTDSEQLFNNIADHGIDETWKNVYGAATIVFWNNQAKTLNIVSNGERPFSFTFVKDEKQLWFASESWMLKGALGRNLKIDKEDLIVEPKKNWLITFKIENNSLKMIARELEKAPAITRYRTHNTYYPHETTRTFDIWDNHHHSANRHVFVPEKDNVRQFKARKGPELRKTDCGEYITKTKFFNDYPNCAWCGVPHDDFGEAILYAEDNMICKGCHDTACIDLNLEAQI